MACTFMLLLAWHIYTETMPSDFTVYYIIFSILCSRRYQMAHIRCNDISSFVVVSLAGLQVVVVSHLPE